MDRKNMTVAQVKENTWVIKSWIMIPFYKIDDTRCILLDSGLHDQREALEKTLEQEGLTCVGILGSHAHIDHNGSHAYFQKKYHACIAMSLGEAGRQATVEIARPYCSPWKKEWMEDSQCTADILIMPQDTQVTLCGVTFDVFHTPGHTADHIAVRTPDHVLYLGDAIMTGRELFKSKFPYAYSISGYFESLRKLRTVDADFYIAAHWGVYPEIRSFIDMEIRFLSSRMLEILELVEGKMSVEQMTRKLCDHFQIHARKMSDMVYFQEATHAYILYLVERGQVEAVMEHDTIRFGRTPQSFQSVPGEGEALLPRPGSLSVELAMNLLRKQEGIP